MYFDTAPKTRKEDLFGVDFQLELLKKYLLDESVRMIVIKGLRRTGKTSLLNVTLNEISIKNIKIDVRDAPYYDKKEFMLHLIEKIKESIGESLFQKILRYISKIELSYKDITAAFKLNIETNFSLFFERLDKQLKAKNSYMILAFDEAQLLKNINFDYFLASIFDNYRNIRILLTGSEIGMLDKLLGKRDYEAPLFGRACLEIEIKRIKEEDIKKFLEIGFNQINKKVEFEEIRDVIENLDGIIGWATYYGWFRQKGLSHVNALEKVKEEGTIITKKELENFLKGRKAKVKYLKIIKYLGKGYSTWTDLKHMLVKENLKISDRQLNLYLRELIDFSFIEKINETYFVSDPLLIRAVA